MKSYRGAWLLTVAVAALAAWWTFAGDAAWRRLTLAAEPTATARTAEGFVALRLPRITPGGSRYALSEKALRARLKLLKRAGYVTIGLKDVDDLYARRRKLPEKALLLVFGDDDAQGLEVADRVMAKLGLRGAAFVSRDARAATVDERRYLTRYALSQMRRGGAWDFGWIAQPSFPEVPGLQDAYALFDPAASTAPAPGRFRLRFEPSELGYNDLRDDPRRLKAMSLRASRDAGEETEVVENSWPRRSAYADDFGRSDLDRDWIAGWGVLRAGGRRLTLVPAPRHTGAGIFLRGTETWRDLVLEFELKKHEREFWVYARYKDEGSFVRVGARDGYWYVEQKISPAGLPTMLARAPFVETGAPTRARFVLKGDKALLHVDGRMLFGRSLRVHPSIERGRVLVSVYDRRLKTALGVLGSFKAEPVRERWLALKGLGALGDARLQALREQAVYARALSPRWVSASRDGSVFVAPEQETLVRSLAGFYGCRLVPTVELPAGGAVLEGAAGERLMAGLSEAARSLEVPGLNLRMRGEDLARPSAGRFLARLRRGFAARRRELWVTTEGRGLPPASLAVAVDGVLKPSGEGGPAEPLVAAPLASFSANSLQAGVNR